MLLLLISCHCQCQQRCCLLACYYYHHHIIELITGVSLDRVAEIYKKAACSLCNGVWMTHSDINKVKVISELLSIRHSYVNLDCFSSEDIDFMMNSCVPIRPSSFISCVFLFFIFHFFCVLLYDIHFHHACTVVHCAVLEAIS